MLFEGRYRVYRKVQVSVCLYAAYDTNVLQSGRSAESVQISSYINLANVKLFLDKKTSKQTQ